MTVPAMTKLYIVAFMGLTGIGVPIVGGGAPPWTGFGA